MKMAQHTLLAKAVVCALLVTTTVQPALASRPHPLNTIPTKSQATWIVVAVVAIAAGVGVGVYFAVRPHGLTGCASSGPNGLQLANESDQQTYALGGGTTDVKAGDRVRVSGKKEKRSAAGFRPFEVSKLVKDYGACPATPAAH